MGDVHSRRSPPFPSPSETVPPVAVPQPHHLQPSRSPSSYRSSDPDHASRIFLDGLTEKVDGAATLKAKTGNPRFSRGDSAEKVAGLTPITEDTRSGSERKEDQGRSSQTLKELRRQMEELLVYQQMQQQQNQVSSAAQIESAPQMNETPRKRRLSATTASGDIPSTVVQPSSGSVGSTGTIKAGETPASPVRTMDQTPSYPFPRVQSQTQPAFEQTGRQGQFRLKLPSEKVRSGSPASQQNEEQHVPPKSPGPAPVFLPPQHKDLAEESMFPSPSLYDVTLKLNTDPGLEAWWSNLVEILQVHYGAERVSLAVPGDATDLENVPWGQKAIFNQDGSTIAAAPQALSAQDCPLSDQPGTRSNSDGTEQKLLGTSVARPKTPGPVPPCRPSLPSRHSFAGFTASGETEATSRSERHVNLPKNDLTKSGKRHARVSAKAEATPSSSSQRNPVTEADSNCLPNNSTGNVRQAVFPMPRPLEVESDPLIKRTGVVRLFGRTTPVVLTREYSSDSARGSQRPTGFAQSPLDTVQVTPNAEGPSGPGSRTAANSSQAAPTGSLSAPIRRQYDEYEQVPQSPWSQSPAPSPAPRTHADQNPFFTSHTVDEGAFSKDPPQHDYANTQSLEAIGVDHSKTVIHIPLLHGGRSNQASSSTLRFPVAIVSVLSTIVPYPPNLRQSLAWLMPHLTTSFCLAQQYSQLERQVSSKVDTPRYGHLLGLGGTFSDASSELELVAGLSGHVSYSVGDENSMSARASIASPSDNSSTRFSPAISSRGTPGFELGHVSFGSTTQSPALAPRGGDTTDSYFNVQHPKSTRDNLQHQRSRLQKSKTNTIPSTPTSPGKLPGKVPAGDEKDPQDSSLVIAYPLQDSRPPAVVSPTQQSSRQASTNSFYAQLQRELPRPFSDTIAQLMLNSIPLHLFLAKPQSGEVIWTNAKFDAYRRSKPHEQKLRDPWQNIHSSERDHVSSEWTNALRTGSQFTERVRVRRFNDETAYRWFIFRANPLLSSTGEVLYWIGSFLDIHEQHIAELKAAQEREKFATDAKYRAFSNSIPQIVFEATENRGLIFVNEQWNLYTGQSLQDALDLGFAKHVHPDDLEKCGGLSMQAKQDQNKATGEMSHQTSADNGQGKPPSNVQKVVPALDELVRRGVASLQKDENGRVFYSTEIRLRSRGGDFRWHLVRLVRVEASSFGSEESSWYGTCTDINDRKNLERELNKAMSQLNNQMESKTKFFSNMSHEIRTPLNGILGTLPFILDTQLDSDQRRMLDTIQNSSTGLRELVDNILDVSRVEAGKMSMVNSWFHVRSMIEEVIDTVYSRAIDKHLEVNYLMDTDVPTMVIGDRFRIRQVLLNLVGNAVKFTSQGEVHICCNLLQDAPPKTKETEVFLNFDVIDTGKGFSTQDAQRLMQRFSQLGESSSQQNAGSGLGLFLSKQLVEMHGGKLTPSSKEGQGAKFSFNVKVDAPPPPPPSERPNLFRHPSGASRRPGASRTTSYDQHALAPSRSFDPKLPDMASFSPGLDSAAASPILGSSAPIPGSLHPLSAVSSALPTPEIGASHPTSGFDQNKLFEATSKPRSPPSLEKGAKSVSDPPVRLIPPPSEGSVSPSKASAGFTPPAPQGPFSIVILCPLEHTRSAAKQHIEQVVPHEIPFTITAFPDVDEWRDAQSGPSTQCTHLILNLPSADEITDVIQYVESDVANAPVLVIVSDPYQKRQIHSRVSEFAATGKQVFVVNKPAKPSAFSVIFDPEKKRELSRDHREDQEREASNNFKTVSKMVKEVLGNKGYRILLVEDDETNRNVSRSHTYLRSGLLTWPTGHAEVPP